MKGQRHNGLENRRNRHDVCLPRQLVDRDRPGMLDELPHDRLAVLAASLDGDISLHGILHQREVHLRGVALYQSDLLHVPDALPHGGLADAELLGDLDVRLP